MSVVVDELLRDTFSCFGASRVSNFHNRGINLRNPNISFSDFYLLNVGMSGSSYWSCSVKIGVLKTFATFTGKHLY